MLIPVIFLSLYTKERTCEAFSNIQQSLPQMRLPPPFYPTTALFLSGIPHSEETNNFDGVSKILSKPEEEESDHDVWQKISLKLASILYDQSDPSSLPKNPSDLTNYFQILTLIRVTFPSLIFGIILTLIYPSLAISTTEWIANHEYAAGTFELILTDNANQFIQNVHNVGALIFSLLTGFTYYFMYSQQETIFYALFDEVSITKTLLEQCALISRGRINLYERLLRCIQCYVDNDLKATPQSILKSDQKRIEKYKDIIIQEDWPAVLLGKSRMDPGAEDYLETILYLTSVGEPGYIYDTVRSLRQARAKRLGGLQR